MSYLLKRNSRIEEDLIDQLFNSSEKRLARLLLLLANFDKESSLQSIKVRVSQETLAEMIGTTRSRVNYFMNKFRKLGLISYNRQIEVHNSLLNAGTSSPVGGHVVNFIQTHVGYLRRSSPKPTGWTE